MSLHFFPCPDGTSVSPWDITPILHYGPDGFLNWGCLPVITTIGGIFSTN